jgi:hypothetical protein
MFGIFVGFAATVGYAWGRGWWRRTKLPRGLQLGLLIGFVALMGLDGLNALYTDLGGQALYAPRNDLRLVTGLLCGFSLACFIAPAVSEALFRDREDRPLFGSGWALGGGLLVLAGVAAFSLAPFVPPRLLSLVAAASVVGGFAVVNLHFAVLAWDGPAWARGWSDLKQYALAGVGFAILELAGLSLLRGILEGYGVRWVV